MKSVPTIAFDYRPSRGLVAAVLVMGALAVLAVMLSGLPWWARAVGALLALGYALLQWRSLYRGPVKAAAWRGDGVWVVRDAQGMEREAELSAARVLAHVIFLQLLVEGRRAGLVLTAGNLDADRHRRLRMRLLAHGTR